MSKAFQAETQSTQTREGKAGSVWYNTSIWGNSQRCFHSTPEIGGTPSTLKVFRDWWAEKDKQISDYRDNHDDQGTHVAGILKTMASLSLSGEGKP